MKRCSQCHFIFEDYDQFCDFDSTELRPYPEPVSPSKNAALIFEGSVFIRLLTSRVSLAIFSLVGIISSALLIGYYDAASQSDFDTLVKSQNREATVNQVLPAGVSTTQPASPNAGPPAQPGIQLPADLPARSGKQSPPPLPVKSRLQPSPRARFQSLPQARVSRSAQPRAQSAAQPRVPAPTESRVELSSQPGLQPVGVTVSDNFARQLDVAAKNSSQMPCPPRTTSLPRASVRSSTPLKTQTRAIENAHLKKKSRPSTILKKTGNVLKKTGSLLKKPFAR